MIIRLKTCPTVWDCYNFVLCLSVNGVRISSGADCVLLCCGTSVPPEIQTHRKNTLSLMLIGALMYSQSGTGHRNLWQFHPMLSGWCCCHLPKTLRVMICSSDESQLLMLFLRWLLYCNVRTVCLFHSHKYFLFLYRMKHCRSVPTWAPPGLDTLFFFFLQL